MNFPMFRGEIRADVPTAIVALGRFFIATAAVERAAEEELFEPVARFIVEIAGFERQIHFAAAAITTAVIELGEQGSKVIVHAARHDAITVAERAGDAKLGGDGFTNKSALVG